MAIRVLLGNDAYTEAALSFLRDKRRKGQGRGPRHSGGGSGSFLLYGFGDTVFFHGLWLFHGSQFCGVFLYGLGFSVFLFLGICCSPLFFSMV